jgi:hypothetical protein
LLLLNSAENLNHPSALGLSISQALFVSKLLSKVPKHTSAIPPETVVSHGATVLAIFSNSTEVVTAIRLSYSNVVYNALLYALVTACVALVFACGIERINLKTVAEEKKKKRVINDTSASNWIETPPAGFAHIWRK